MADWKPTARKRAILYSSATLVLGALSYMGFVYAKNVPPDPLTSLSIARLHLGLAQVIPERDKTGKALPFRADHLDKAAAALDEAERAAPGLAIVREFRAFKAWIEGDFRAAESWYREALSIDGNTPEFDQKTRLNLARVLLEDGRTKDALGELARMAATARNAAWHLTRAKVFQADGELGARDEALSAALERAKKSDQDTLRRIADASFEWGDGKALSCYEAIEKKDPMCWYRIARLKIAAGEIDSCKNALANVRQRAPALLDGLLKEDAEFWKPWEASVLKRDAETPKAVAPDPGK